MVILLRHFFEHCDEVQSVNVRIAWALLRRGEVYGASRGTRLSVYFFEMVRMSVQDFPAGVPRGSSKFVCMSSGPM